MIIIILSNISNVTPPQNKMLLYFITLIMGLVGFINAGTSALVMKVEGSSIHSVSPLLPLSSSLMNVRMPSHSSKSELNVIEADSSFHRIGETRKFVTIYIPPTHFDEPEQPNVIRVGGKPNKHVNIVFVKLQSLTSSNPTEVILPDPPQHKNIVYVLLKKQDPSENIRIVRPEPVKQVKPEVYFIRYKTPVSPNETTEDNLVENPGHYTNTASAGGTFVEAPVFSTFSDAY